MSELERLRNEVAKRRQAATNKINRTRRQSGANIAGSQFDPRRNAGVESRYNRQQLRNYLVQLNDFMRRGNQFVSGSGGAPLPRGKFNAYKKLEAEQNAIRIEHDKRMGSIQTPTGMSIAGNKEMLHQGQGQAVYGPYRKFDRASTDIPSVTALEKLRRDMVSRVSSNFLPNRIQQGKENLKKALLVIGETQYMEQIDALNDFQFDAFWYGTNVAEAVFMQYGMQTERNAEETATQKERWQDKVIESAVAELGSVLQWATGLEPGNAQDRTSQKAPRSKRRK